MAPASVRLLIVDDDVGLQYVLKRAAETAGYEVVQMFDGATGLASALQGQFDLIVLDIEMPNMDGRDVLNRLKQNPGTASVPVLVCSGRESTYDRRVVLELGAADHIEKPVRAELLMTRIGRMVQAARDRR